MRRVWITLAAVGAFAAFVLLIVAGNSLAHYRGWTVLKLEPAALSGKISPYYRIMEPVGGGPFPTALIYSGCDGPKDNVVRWAEMLNRQGWAAIIVDSHAPRGFSDYEIWRLVCAGQLFMGSERAGDVLVSIDDARRMRFVDPDRIVLIGSSHGGWAIMDLLALTSAGRLPFNLAALPAGSPPDPLQGVVGAILLYPYCGEANRAHGDGWRTPLPVLFMLSAHDLIAPSGHCVEIADKLRTEGLPVETLVFEGATHGFDQQDRSAFSPLEFDQPATDEALRKGADFLDRVGVRG